MVTILRISAKITTLGFLEIKVLLSNGYNVIISSHAVTSKILSRVSNCMVNAVMWPKFGNIYLVTFIWEKLS